MIKIMETKGIKFYTAYKKSAGYSLMWNDTVCIEPSFGIATSIKSSTYKTKSGGSVFEDDYDAPSKFGMAIGLGIHIRLGGE